MRRTTPAHPSRFSHALSKDRDGAWARRRMRKRRPPQTMRGGRSERRGTSSEARKGCLGSKRREPLVRFWRGAVTGRPGQVQEVPIRDSCTAANVTLIGSPRHGRALRATQRKGHAPAPRPDATAPNGYSMSSSARVSRLAGISIPSAFAVLRLITSSKWFGCSIGSSAGLAPLMILSWRCRMAVRCTRADARPRAQNRLPAPCEPRGPIPIPWD